MRRICAIVVFGLFFSGGLFAQFVDLEEALKKKQITLTANGNGRSSGASVEGILENRSSAIIRVRTALKEGLYLVNSGAGQNMAAAGVYLRDGSYYSDGTEAYIELEPRKKTEVIFMAFCADFGKENPVSGESFRTAAMPSEIRQMVSKISRYMADHPGGDIVIAAQIALWLFMGENTASIAGKFVFTKEDVELAKALFAY